MSAELFGLGLKAAMPTHVAKLVLLRLLDACEADGTRIFPGIASIAQAAQCSERQAQRMMKLFTGAGLLVLVDPGGHGPGSTAEYRLDLDLFRRIAREGWSAVCGGPQAGSDEAAGEAPGEGRQDSDSAPKGDTMSPFGKGDIQTPKGDIRAPKGDTQMSPDPSVDPSIDPSGREGARASHREAEPDPAPAAPAEATLAVDQAWDRLRKVWPDIATQSGELARAALAKLSGRERLLAVERVPAFIAYHGATQKKGARLPFLHNYLGEKHRFMDLPKEVVTPKPAGPVFLGAFDRAWWCMLIRFAAAHWDAIRDPRSAAGQAIRRQISAAFARIGWRVEAGEAAAVEAAAAGYVQVEVGSADWRAWAAWWQARTGLDLPAPSVARFAWLPARAPPDDGPGLLDERDVAEAVGR